MLDKTKNLFTCSIHGDREGIRFPVCHHVRAWVKKEIASSYAKGYEAGKSAAYFAIEERAKQLKEPGGLPRHLFTVEELVQQDYGYMCAKKDILGGLE